ncbi:hypothetical protein P8452_43419 [Trifolium repens]|nr:hypothetical protein P8452_43419 [Trifolium repens]
MKSVYIIILFLSLFLLETGYCTTRRIDCEDDAACYERIKCKTNWHCLERIFCHATLIVTFTLKPSTTSQCSGDRTREHPNIWLREHNLSGGAN